MGRTKGMGGHHSHASQKDEWLTPPHILDALGPFDLDPCAPIVRPWPTAAHHLTIEDDGLSAPWPPGARVWCNPPYGKAAEKWLTKLADHGNGIALIFARTETKMFFDQVWDRAHGLLFLRGRLHFYHVDGTMAVHNSGAPSVLVAYNTENADRLASSGLDGQFIPLEPKNLVIGDGRLW